VSSPRAAPTPHAAAFDGPLRRLAAVPVLDEVDARALVPDSLPRPRRHLERQVLGVPGLLIALDVAALAVGAVAVRPPLWSGLVFAGLLLLARSVARYYRPRFTVSALDDLPRAAGSALTALGAQLGAQAVFGWHSARAVLAFAAIAFATSVVFGALAGAGVRRVRRHGPRDRALIVGTGSVGRLLGEALLDGPQFGLLPVGYIDQHAPRVIDLDSGTDSGPQVGAAGLPVPVLSDRIGDLGATIATYGITTVVLAFHSMPESQAVDAIIAAHQRGSSVLVVPHVLDLHHDGPDVDRVRGIPLVRLRPDPTMRPTWFVKRALDVLVAGSGLILLMPLLALLGLAVLLESGRPMLFWQQRIGVDGRSFSLCKFRSMRPVPVVESQTTWTDTSRISTVGRFLRASSLDEVPQLWNVLRGDMSLVGPRPERPTFVERFSHEHERYWARHRVPVGLTGLAQVNGLRGDTSIADRALFDNYYIANWSLWLDVKIVLLTAREVLRGSGG
jgi:exopolysaccharide biosynthesis polyprenyl glycosylphosphotransferase